MNTNPEINAQPGKPDIKPKPKTPEMTFGKALIEAIAFETTIPFLGNPKDTEAAITRTLESAGRFAGKITARAHNLLTRIKPS